MKSKTAEYLDYPYDRLQVGGGRIYFENLSDETEIQSCVNDEYSQRKYTGWGMYIVTGIFTQGKRAGRFMSRQMQKR